MNSQPTTNSIPLVGWETYDDFDRQGRSIEARWLRVGRRRFRAEIGPWALYVRLGTRQLSIGYERVEVDG